jgi:hypothetical protein
MSSLMAMRSFLRTRVVMKGDGKGRLSEATAFLETLRPSGPWVLTAIIPDGRTETITARDERTASDFIRRHDGHRNIYYSANPTSRPLTSKAKKTDIASAEYIFADLDPRDDESPEDAKARYLERLATFDPYPTTSSTPVTESKRYGGLPCRSSPVRSRRWRHAHEPLL